jgi:hypothetical protein
MSTEGIGRLRRSGGNRSAPGALPLRRDLFFVFAGACVGSFRACCGLEVAHAYRFLTESTAKVSEYTHGGIMRISCPMPDRFAAGRDG